MPVLWRIPETHRR